MSRLNSMIGWVDFSSTERERVSQVLAMLKEKGTLDELGIGQVRDAFAEQLFPGFSTIQTRAKYLVTVPRIFDDYTQLETKLRRKTSLLDYIHQQEDLLAENLVERHQDEKVDGIIGSESVGKGGVARKPSSVYWNAFRQFGIANTQQSLKEFCKQFETLVNQPVHHLGGEDDDDDVSTPASLMQKMPSNEAGADDKGQSDWLEVAEIGLTREEANYLKQKFLNARAIEHSVPAQLFRASLLEGALEIDREYLAGRPDQGWRLDVLYHWLKDKSISEKCKKTLRNALEFSLAMEGAHLRYNCLVARQANNETQLAEYEKQFDEWRQQYSQSVLFSDGYYQYWLIAAFRDGRKVNSKTEPFIANWCKLIADGTPVPQLDDFIKKRANDNKGSRSLLKKALSENQGWVGMHKLEYRWPSAVQILSDIEQGLNR
ncbi:DUF6361 family protein [Photobacterium satsumensis]|uniref:DUF6361 family protein n=1 Tax=Photobacterium satsumensis TaxID=2910239 RepID=UPI003D09E77F